MTTRLTVTTAPPVPALDSTLVFLLPDFHMLPNDCTSRSRSTCKFAPTPGAIRALCHRRNETIDALRYYYRFPDLTLHVRGCYQRQCERDCLHQVDDVYGAWERLDGGCKRRMHMADHHWNPSTMHWQRQAANNECFMSCGTTYNDISDLGVEVERARLTHCAASDQGNKDVGETLAAALAAARDCLQRVDDVYGAWERLDGGCKRRMHMADHHWNPSTMHWQRQAAKTLCREGVFTVVDDMSDLGVEMERARLTHCADADASFPYYAPPSSLARRAPDALCPCVAFVVLFCFAVSLGCQWRAAYIARRARRPFYLHVGKKSACTQVSSTT
jgi:hypothetical protein